MISVLSIITDKGLKRWKNTLHDYYWTNATEAEMFLHAQE